MSKIRKAIMKFVPAKKVAYKRNKFGRVVPVQTAAQKKRAARQKKFEKMMRGGYRP